jgi:hypothetical protein
MSLETPLCLSVSLSSVSLATLSLSLSQEEYGKKKFATLVEEVEESYEEYRRFDRKNRSLYSTTKRIQELPPLYRATRHQSLVVKKKKKKRKKKKKKIVAVNCFILDSN